MVQRADEVIDARGGGNQGRDERAVFGAADPFAFEADQDVDRRGVFGLETRGFGEVGGVLGNEPGEGGLAVVGVKL